jgi:hypothetical protein
MVVDWDSLSETRGHPGAQKTPPPTLPYCCSQLCLPAASFLLPAAQSHCLKWGFRATLMGFLLPSLLGVASLQFTRQLSDLVSWGHPSFTHVQPCGVLVEMEFVHSFSSVLILVRQSPRKIQQS